MDEIWVGFCNFINIFLYIFALLSVNYVFCDSMQSKSGVDETIQYAPGYLLLVFFVDEAILERLWETVSASF